MNRNLILVRHGRSTWNLENKFTGWVDVDLAEMGIVEAKKSGSLINEINFKPQICFTSYLKRAQDTLTYILNELENNISSDVINIVGHLNERHYGSLQGLNKDDTLNKYGEEQFLKVETQL